MGQTRTLPTAWARSMIARVTEALSFTGFVLGMGQTAVKPPRAAARVPLSMVSEDSSPGSRRWQCRSMKPGATSKPDASRISAELARMAGATCAIRSPSSRMSSAASVELVGSSRRPFLISSMGGNLRVDRCGPDQEKEQGHAHGQPVGDLFEHAGLRAVGHCRVDFESADHGSWVQHKRFRARTPQPLGRELVEENVLLERQSRLMEALLLHAEDEDHLSVVQGFFNARDAAHRLPQALEFPRHPHGRAAQREAVTKLSEQVKIRPRHTTVQDVAEDGHLEAFERSPPVPNR